MSALSRRVVLQAIRKPGRISSGCAASMNPRSSRAFSYKHSITRANVDSPTSTTTSFAAFTSSPQPTGNGGTPRVRSMFLGLTALALLATCAGVYMYYGSFKTWPAELRGDLRAAVKAQQQGEWPKSEARYRRALQSAMEIEPLGKLGNNASLKISGIRIALASMLEQSGELRKAYDVYSEALQEARKSGTSATTEERLRAIALAQRCGDLARIKEVHQSIAKDASTSVAEEHLQWSVEELLRLAVPENMRKGIIAGDQEAIMLSDLELPAWLTRTTVGASLESLGQLYASQGKASYAVPLYVQAIDLVMPADKAKRTHEPTVAERCRAGILMNNVSQLMVDATEGGKPNVEDAQRWAMRGLDIVAFALRGTGWDMKAGGQGFKNIEGTQNDQRAAEVRGTCWMAEVALLINLGELARMQQDTCKARKLFQQAYQRADTYGMREARSRCAQALSELERTAAKA